jgi:autotransporter-associated beta strand protein
LNNAELSVGAATSTFAGVISGTGGLKKVGGGQLTLSGDNSYSGVTTVSGGTLEIANAGAIDQSSGVTIDLDAEITGVTAFTINAPVTINGRLTGNATINGNVTSNGGLQPGNTSIPPGGSVPNPGQDMGQITINGNYSSSGTTAYVGMFVDLDAALPANGTPGTTHDFLTVNGNVSGSDPTSVYLAEFDDAADTGAATTGNGIQLIRVTGANSGSEFRQGSAITAGSYQYLLTYVANYSGTDDGYFLQSAVRDEMVAHPALLSAGQQMLRQCFRDDQRIPDSPKGATYGRAWAGYRRGASNYGADTGIDMDLDFGCTTGGMDWRMGYGWFGGVSGGFGSANSDLAVPSGTGNLDGDARVIEAYAAFTSSSFFVNLSAGYADMDWTYSSRLTAPTLTSVGGLIASAQAGLALDLDLFAVKLIGAVNYDDTNCGESCFGFAATEDTGLMEAKGTVRFDGVTWGGSVRPWASVSFSDVLSDGINTVSAVSGIASADTNSELLSIDAGLLTYLDENFALFADGGYHESLSKDINGYKGGVGLKLYW